MNILKRIQEIAALVTQTTDAFDEGLRNYLTDALDKRRALKDLDKTLGGLVNELSTLSVLVKHQLTLDTNRTASSSDEEKKYSKKQVALMYCVTIKTVENWIKSGLVSEKARGSVRITASELTAFAARRTTKKMHWRIARPEDSGN